MDLQTLQADFRRVMLGGRSEVLTGLVQPAGTLSPSQSLKVYCRNMQGALTQALRDIYPVCVQLLGDVRFRGIAAGYAQLRPSENSDLNLYGEGFPDFLRLYCEEHAGDEQMRGLACLPDLARLEWHYHFAYYAADDVAFDFAAFSKVGESGRGRIVLTVGSAVALMSSSYPLRAVWRSRARPDGRVRGREYLCVYRDGLRPALTRLSRPFYRLLGDIVEGETLDVLSQRFQGLDRRLPLLVKKGWVASFYLKRDARTP